MPMMQRRGFLQLMAGLFTVAVIPKLVSALEPETSKPILKGPQGSLPEGMFTWYADVFAEIESLDEVVTTIFVPIKYYDAMTASCLADHNDDKSTTNLWGATVVWVRNPHVFAMGEYGTTAQGHFMQDSRTMKVSQGHG